MVGKCRDWNAAKKSEIQTQIIPIDRSAFLAMDIFELFSCDQISTALRFTSFIVIEERNASVLPGWRLVTEIHVIGYLTGKIADRQALVFTSLIGADFAEPPTANVAEEPITQEIGSIGDIPDISICKLAEWFTIPGLKAQRHFLRRFDRIVVFIDPGNLTLAVNHLDHFGDPIIQVPFPFILVQFSLGIFTPRITCVRG